jgi:hypothetical protein
MKAHNILAVACAAVFVLTSAFERRGGQVFAEEYSAEVLKAFENIKQTAMPSIPERCNEALLNALQGFLGDVPAQQKQALMNARLKEMKASSCITDAHFHLLVDSKVPNDAQGPCRAALREGETLRSPFTITEASGITVVRVRDFFWYSWRCGDFKEVTRGMLDDLVVRLKGHKDVVADFRGNGGGFVVLATAFVEKLFSPKADFPLITRRAGDGMEDYVYTRSAGAFACSRASIVDRRTASAAEIAVGALKAMCTDMAIVGEPTVGKGAISRFEGVGTNVAQYSVGEILIGVPPNLTRINGEGISIDVLVNKDECVPDLFCEKRGLFDSVLDMLRNSAPRLDDMDRALATAVGIARDPERFIVYRQRVEALKKKLNVQTQAN